MAFGGLLVMRGEINLGQFVAAELIIFGVLSAFISFVKKLETYYDMVAAIDKIGALEDLPRDVSKSNHIALSHPVTLTFDKVSYCYLARRNVIDDLSFSIEKGNSTAFLGAQGAGKSTLCDLITALRLPSQGTIYINNIDIRQLNLANLREQIGVASQVQILEESILENIRLFDEAIHISQVQAVLAGLNIATETAELPAGLDTILSGNGSPLNASQAQLLMVARAVINKPSLLVIDSLFDELSNAQLTKALQFMASFNPDCTLVILTSKVEVASHLSYHSRFSCRQSRRAIVADQSAHHALLEGVMHLAQTPSYVKRLARILMICFFCVASNYVIFALATKYSG